MKTCMFRPVRLTAATLALTAMMSLAGYAAAISYSGGTYSQDFDSLPDSGTSATWNNGSTLTGWFSYSDGTTAYTTIEVNDGSNAEHITSLGNNGSTDRAFGGREYKDFFTIAAQFTNNSGGDFTAVTIEFTTEQWRVVPNNPGTVQNLDLTFEYSLDATSPADGTATWNPVSQLDAKVAQTTAASAQEIDGNLAQNQTNSSYTISLIAPWADGDDLYLRWQQPGATASDSIQGAQPALDDFSFSAVIPEPGSLALLGLGSLLVLGRRRRMISL